MARRAAAAATAFEDTIDGLFVFEDVMVDTFEAGSNEEIAALVSVMVHVRIGLWQVLTDYVKPTGLRATLQYVLNIIAFAYVAVGLFVLWGV